MISNIETCFGLALQQLAVVEKETLRLARRSACFGGCAPLVSRATCVRVLSNRSVQPTCNRQWRMSHISHKT